jgi:hypothetical protein
VTLAGRERARRSAMRTTVLAFGDLEILVESTEASHLRWLEEFLLPHFARGAGGGPDCRVAMIEDEEGYGAALALGPGAGTLDAFALDTNLLSLPRWRGAGTRLFDGGQAVFYEVTDAPYAVAILSATGNMRGRTALMRVVRELATNRAQRVGGVLLHASAFAAGGKGIVAAGPKGAGKTTLLIHALRAGSVQYVSNDRVLLPAGAASPVAHGVPTIVSLRRETLDPFPALAARVAARAYSHRLTLEESAAGRKAPGKHGLSPAQLCGLLDVRPLARCEVAALLFPRVTDDAEAFSLRRLPEAEAAERATGALFAAASGRSCSEVFSVPGDPPAPDRAILSGRCRDLVARIPCFECRLGARGLGSVGAAEDLIASLLR